MRLVKMQVIIFWWKTYESTYLKLDNGILKQIEPTSPKHVQLYENH